MHNSQFDEELGPLSDAGSVEQPALVRSRTQIVSNSHRHEEGVSQNRVMTKLTSRMREFLDREKELYEEMIFTDEDKNL